MPDTFQRTQRVLLGVCSTLLCVLLVAEIVIVLLRYCFGMGFLQLQDVASHAFAALVLLALAPALQADRHVRVDVFREHQSVRMRRRFDRLGIIVLLMPVFAMTFFLSLPEVIYAWQIQESSRETGGLGGLFLVKTLLPVMCLLMLLMGAGLLLGNPRRKPEESQTVSKAKATYSADQSSRDA